MCRGIREGLLMGCGNPLLDISAAADLKLLQKYGLKPDNAILAEDRHKPLYQELVDLYKAEYLAGGSVQNTLRVAQWIIQKPNVAVFFGCVGDDKFAKILENKARSDGVNVQYQYTQEASTGTCAVLITGTHRSLCANLAAANLFTADHLRTEKNRKFIVNAEYFYISGFFLTVSPESIMEIAHFSNKHNRTFIMNLSAPFLSQLYKEPLMAAFPFIDILFGNETEAVTFAQTHGWEETDLKEIGKKMIQLPKENSSRPRIVILTQGHDPVLLIQQDSIEEFPVEKLEREKVVDTNGAGDAFVGGFLSQFIQKQSLEVCIRCGIWAAGHIIQRSGCSFEGSADFKP